MEPSQYSHIDQVQQAAIQFGLACVKTRVGHLGTGKDKIIFDVRDSLIYRNWAVRWHLQVLRQQHLAIEKRLMLDMNGALNDPQYLHHSQQIMSYIFDDVIFNLAAMFDYVGNLVGLAYRGPAKSRTKWNGAVKGARDSNNTISKAPVGELLKTVHASWVNHLMDFRGDHIHHKAELGNAAHTLSLNQERLKVEVNVSVPRSLAKRLLTADDQEVDVMAGADKIAETSAMHCNAILNKMTETLEPAYW